MKSMVDCIGRKVVVGDWVRYWHKRFGGARPAVGEVIAIDTNNVAEIKYSQADSAEGDTICFRAKSGITLITMGEAMMFTLERATLDIEA